ncbi:YidH family protein [Achromobacter animicus]|uniref:YidH family protein n=1 Tax=Achromobacter animicus TaxID=1389935 RepID=UPI00244841C9|nr:DUF202 domain-containing protein [Achromobacter animicus]MDH0683058.1 DUF202 domain-containing protein [Achromobacter animicus]
MANEDRSPWYRQGVDPDYRFSLANERTFLAWVRTTLALIAAAVVFDQIAEHVPESSGLRYMALSLAFFGLALSAGAYVRWRANEVAMRLQQPLPVSKGLAAVALSVGMICLSAIYWIVR